jgi:hypothetical protein
MTRVASGDTVTVKPANNMYTVLAGVASLVTLLGLIILIIRAKDLLGPGGLFGS